MNLKNIRTKYSSIFKYIKKINIKSDIKKNIYT